MSKIFACFPDISEVVFNDFDRAKVKMWMGEYGQFTVNLFNATYNGMDQIQIMPIHKIPAGTPYNIFIKCRGFEGVDSEKLKSINQQNIAYVFDEIINNRIKNPNYKKILHDSQLGLVNWWFDYGWEKIIIRNRKKDEYFEELWNRLITSLNCQNHPGNINLMTGAEPCYAYDEIKSRSGINVVYANPFETVNNGIYHSDNEKYWSYTEFLNLQSNAIQQKKINQTAALVYNRVPRPLRALLLSHLESRGYLDRTLYSWGGYDVVYGSTEQEKSIIISHWIDDIDYMYETTGQQYKDTIINWFYRESVSFFDESQDIDLKQNQADNVNLMHPQYCNFQIITETCYNVLPFLTEKTFKAISQLMPFVLLSPGAGCIQALRDKGYRTYDKWIDHSYDNPGSFDERFALFSKELDRLYNLTPEEWSDIRAEMLSDMLYNVNHLKMRGDLSYSHIFYK